MAQFRKGWRQTAARTDRQGGADRRGKGDDAGKLAKFGGKKLGKNSWVFQREPLVAYYQELMNDPSRLVKVFDSMKPARGDNGKITGYRLSVEGEADFFEAAGLKDGDVVKEVNSVPMTNRRLAEYFIGEFARGRANGFVLGVERGQKTEKQVYQVRGRED